MTTKVSEAGATEAAAVDVNAIAAVAVAGSTARISAILALPEAKDKGAMAQHFALKTSLSVDDAKAALLVSPSEVKAEPAKDGGFKAAMASTENPEVAAGSAGGTKQEEDVVARMQANYARATGNKIQTK